MVDVANWCSVEFQLPYGLYDRAQMRGPVTLRIGRDGEEYAGIRKDVVHVGGRLTVADDEGPFGNPTSDSARTMVTSATHDALVVVYAPLDTAPAQPDARSRHHRRAHGPHLRRPRAGAVAGVTSAAPVVSVIIAAGGRGVRLGADLPKQFLEIGGRSLLERSIERVRHSILAVAEVIVALPDGVRASMAARMSERDGYTSIVWRAGPGGRTRWRTRWRTPVPTPTSSPSTTRRGRSFPPP